MKILKQFLLIVCVSSFLSDMIAVPLANQLQSNLEIVPDISMRDEQSNKMYKMLCKYMIDSEDWFTLRHSAQQACVNLIIAEHSEKPSYKQRRFFALQVGKSLPNQNNDITSKGFKYGRK